MEYQKYLAKKKELYEKIQDIFDDEDHSEEQFQNLIHYIDIEKYQENSDEFKTILQIINHISNSHHRYPTFFSKVEEILIYYSEYIKQSFTNSELFKIFQSNKRVLLFLFEQKVIIVDKEITDMILKQDCRKTSYYMSFDEAEINKKAQKYFELQMSTKKNYCYYFFPEIKSFLNEEERSRIEEKLSKQIKEKFEYENYRKNGENESYICQLIRQDLIKEFGTYVNRINFPLESTIPISAFETNPLLMAKPASLIEYAAFYGSIQIFKYLQLNGISFSPSLWIYSIHGSRPEIVQILSENNINPEDETYMECLEESIKCHNNCFAEYFLNNFIDSRIEDSFDKNKFAFGFHYHNYEFIQDFNDFQSIFYYACLYDYISIVKLLIKTEKIELNKRKISIEFVIKFWYWF